MDKKLGEMFPDWVSFNGPFIQLKSNTIPETLNKSSQFRHLIKPFSNIGLFTFIGMILLTFALFSLMAISVASGGVPSDVTNWGVQLLLLPSINPIENPPIGMIFLSLFSGIVIHELGHAIASVSEGRGIKEYGLVSFGLVPFGAYVKIKNNGSLEAVSSLRITAAGVSANLVIALVSFLLLLTQPLDFNSVYHYYINSVATPSAAGSVPFVTGILFWIFLVNVNIAFANSLPFSILDGGRFVNTGFSEAFDSGISQFLTRFFHYATAGVFIHVSIFPMIF
jgi:membrane-associated protease RseP (regulator of RpoE activity)